MVTLLWLHTLSSLAWGNLHMLMAALIRVPQRQCSTLNSRLSHVLSELPADVYVGRSYPCLTDLWPSCLTHVLMFMRAVFDIVLLCRLALLWVASTLAWQACACSRAPRPALTPCCKHQ
jgi:hypothetical protein